jgi:hypothetical protein
MHFTSVYQSVAFDEVREDEDDEVPDCHEGDDGSVFKRVEAAQKGERYND